MTQEITPRPGQTPAEMRKELNTIKKKIVIMDAIATKLRQAGRANRQLEERAKRLSEAADLAEQLLPE